MKAQLSLRYFDVVSLEFNGERFTAEIKGGSNRSREEYGAIASEIVRRINAFDVLTATLRKAFEELHCDPIGCEVEGHGICAACLAKLEVLAAIEAAEKGEGNAS